MEKENTKKGGKPTKHNYPVIITDNFDMMDVVIVMDNIDFYIVLDNIVLSLSSGINSNLARGLLKNKVGDAVQVMK